MTELREREPEDWNHEAEVSVQLPGTTQSRLGLGLTKWRGWLPNMSALHKGWVKSFRDVVDSLHFSTWGEGRWDHLWVPFPSHFHWLPIGSLYILHGQIKHFIAYLLCLQTPGADARAPAVVLLHQVNTLLCFSFLIGKVGWYLIGLLQWFNEKICISHVEHCLEHSQPLRNVGCYN